MPIYKTGKAKDGKQGYKVVHCYTDDYGKYRQISKTVYGQAEAKIAELELQKTINAKENLADITVEQLFLECLQSQRTELRESSIDRKKSIYKIHISPYLANVKLSKLNTIMLQQWKNTISEKNIGLTMRKNIYRELHALLNFAVKIDRLKTNPLAKLGNFKSSNSVKTPEEKIQYYTAEQFKAFIAAARQHLDTLNGYAMYTFFAIAFYTGMRKGEINALRWSDIKGDILSVNRSVNQKAKGKKPIFTPPKNTSSIRKLKLPKVLLDILKSQKEIQQRNYDFWTEEFLVCGGPTCLSDTGISNRNIQYAREAKLPVIRIHDFRHSHATLLVNSGINIMEISRRLGHTDVSMTWRVYSHLYPREEDRALAVLDEIELA